MKKKKPKKKLDPGTPSRVTAEEALDRMGRFGERRDKFIAAVKKSKD